MLPPTTTIAADIDLSVQPMSAKAPQNTRKPEPGSLRCHLITSRARLWVVPSRWTTEHLSGINWPTPVQLPDHPDNQKSNPCSYVEGSHVFSTLYTLRSTKVDYRRDERIRQLFSLLVYEQSLKRTSSELALLYDGKPITTVSCPIVVRSSSPSRPILAFIDKTWLSDRRYKEFRRRRQPWSITYKTVQKMNELPFDPYYASVLIAMAQAARSLTSDEQIQVYLFVPSTNRKSLQQFSATIPTLYLQKFNDPYKAVACSLVLTERTLSLDRPDTIIEALHDICSGSRSLAVPVPLLKRKAMPNCTNDIGLVGEKRTCTTKNE